MFHPLDIAAALALAVLVAGACTPWRQEIFVVAGAALGLLVLARAVDASQPKAHKYSEKVKDLLARIEAREARERARRDAALERAELERRARERDELELARKDVEPGSSKRGS